MLLVLCGIFDNPQVEYLCTTFGSSMIGLVIGMVIGTIACHFGFIRIRKGTHR
jgi:uncharacterized membrane-anchored protein YhcB (DUF1043 family)